MSNHKRILKALLSQSIETVQTILAFCYMKKLLHILKGRQIHKINPIMCALEYVQKSNFQIFIIMQHTGLTLQRVDVHKKILFTHYFNCFHNATIQRVHVTYKSCVKSYADNDSM